MKLLLYAEVLSCVGVFVAGFVPGPPRLFLLPLGVLVIAAGAVLVLSLTSMTGRAGRRAASSAMFAVAFCGGSLYGTMGMMGHYDINDAVYVTTVSVGALGTIGGGVMALTAM